MGQSGCNAQYTASRRKTLTCSCQGTVEEAKDGIGSEAGRDKIVFSQTDHSSWLHNPHALSEETCPLLRGKKGYQAPIDQIEGVVSKLKRFGDVHDLEMGIVQSLDTCMSTCVIDHNVTDIDTSHSNLRIFIGDVTDPLARAATEIENSMHRIYIRSL